MYVSLCVSQKLTLAERQQDQQPYRRHMPAPYIGNL